VVWASPGSQAHFGGQRWGGGNGRVFGGKILHFTSTPGGNVARHF